MKPKETTRFYPWIVWILAAGFFFAEYFARVSPSVMVPDLMRSFHVTALSLGALSAFFYYAYVGMQLPVGSLIDRFGPHKLLTINAALCGLGCILFSMTHTLAAADLGRFLMGLGAAFAFVGALKLASTWFPLQRFGFFAGLTQALGMLGAAMGEGPVSLLVTRFGWRHTMLLIGFILLGLAVLIGLLVRDKPKTTPVAVRPQKIWLPLLKNLWVVVKNPQTWVNGVVVGFLYAPTAAFAELWGATYLHHVYHFSAHDAAFAISLIFIGWGISSPIMGWVSDRIESRKRIILGSIIMSGIILSIALYTPHLERWMLFPLMLVYGMSNIGVATCYAVACEGNSLQVSGTAMSFANMASVIIGAGFQPLIGWMLDLHWNHAYLHGIPLYSLADYRFAMLALPACFIISLIAWFFLKESFAGGRNDHPREPVRF